MPFLKLDVGILDSSLWADRDAREVFITGLLMAQLQEFNEAVAQLNVRSMEPTAFTVPAGWYGFVRAAGSGIVKRAGLELEAGLAALERLGAEDFESRSIDHGGRRMIRVDGGYLILNFTRYRDKDHTSAERAKRYRERQKTGVTRDASRRTRNVTHADADADADANQEENGEPANAGPALKVKKASFSVPSLEEVRAQCAKIGMPEVDAERFWYYHESRGWIVGRFKMKSWTAALQTWKGNGARYNQTATANRNPANPEADPFPNIPRN